METNLAMRRPRFLSLTSRRMLVDVHCDTVLKRLMKLSTFGALKRYQRKRGGSVASRLSPSTAQQREREREVPVFELRLVPRLVEKLDRLVVAFPRRERKSDQN